MTEKTGCVWLIGAGCGGAGLLRVRCRERRGQCDVVVYDDLIDPKLLEAAPETAHRIYTGQRGGVAGATQDEINRKLVELAQAGLPVVRHEGGEPHLLRRGGGVLALCPHRCGQQA